MMRKKAIFAAALSAALLLGGTGILVRDDVAQSVKNIELQPFTIEVDVQEQLDEITAELLREEPTEAADPVEDVSDEEPQQASPELPPEVMRSLMDSAARFCAAYPDAIGWLYIPDTAVNYPLMQGQDNEFYLHHAYDGGRLSAGSIFLDCRCERRLLNPVNIVYGHNMKNGSMFAGLKKFGDTAYFSAHRYGWLAMPGGVPPLADTYHARPCGRVRLGG